MRLSDLKSGETAVIVKVLGHGAFRKRVMEMGFVKGRKIKAILSAPLKDPVKYSLMGYEVSLRRSEAEMIEVVPIEADYDNSADIPKVNVGESEDYDSVHRERYEGERRTVNVALIGNPNCGKTSLFNVASGAQEHVGNYSGVTVDSKQVCSATVDILSGLSTCRELIPFRHILLKSGMCVVTCVTIIPI